jgi:hypothetical protein
MEKELTNGLQGYCEYSTARQRRLHSPTRAIVTTGKTMDLAELEQVQGRPWDDVDVGLDVGLSRCRKLTGFPALRRDRQLDPGRRGLCIC